jgi:hypothetical protein
MKVVEITLKVTNPNTRKVITSFRIAFSKIREAKKVLNTANSTLNTVESVFSP